MTLRALSLLPMLVVLSSALLLLPPICVATDAPISALNFDFTAWNNLILRYVVPGIIDNVQTNMVDYYRISQDADYITTMTQLESANTTGFTWSQYHAFWINAYNFAIVRAIIEHPCKLDLFAAGCGPISSMLQCGIQQPSAFVVIWDTRVTTVAGKEMTLKDVLERLHVPPSPWRVDARFHSALVSGAVSSPDLTTAFGWPTADLLDSQLNSSMSNWLDNQKKGSILILNTETLWVSRTIKWNLADFNANGKDVWWWLHTYGTPMLRVYWTRPTIYYLDFDWTLNGGVTDLCDSPSRPCYPWWGLLVTVLALAIVLLFIIGCCVCTRVIKQKMARDAFTKQYLIDE